MEYRILGPLEVVDGGRLVDVGTRKQRALLSLLLIAANRVVPLDLIIEELWSDEPPARATSSLRAYISNLRSVLEPHRGPRQPPEVLVTQAPGYSIRLDPEELDLYPFE